jgi:formate C-acetyltransferase
MHALRQELTAYYGTLRRARPEPPEVAARQATIRQAMDAYLAAHPEEPAVALKARLHEAIAETFEPVLFRHSPFFWEMGLRPAENWGAPGGELERMAGAWLMRRGIARQRQEPTWARIEALGMGPERLGLWSGPAYGFDADHHALGSTRLLALGVDGLLAEIAARRERPPSAEQAATLDAMERSLRALLRIAERFAAQAEALLADETDPAARRNLERIAATARRIPARPPETFYEGLAMLWFVREAAATLEAIGLSSLGHVDRQLIALHEADLAAGRLAEAEARDLIARWMLPTDVKFHVHDNAWPETSTCINLGGTDAAGRPVWNALTRLFLEVHREQGLFNPKLNCRYTANAPEAYLARISRDILEGHNHHALLNDAVIVRSLERSGRSRADALRYVNGGCQEPIIEGSEHSAGAYYYVNMPRVLDLCLLPTEAPPPGAKTADLPRPLPEGADWEAAYQHIVGELIRLVSLGAQWRAEIGHMWRDSNPCPLYSATVEGCIASGQDYTVGGARYNPANVCLVGLGTLADALLALKAALYDEGWLSLPTLRRALSEDWRGHEAVRARLMRSPRYGHGDAAADALTARLSHDLAVAIAQMPNERGGRFHASFFVYYQFAHFGRLVRATPDGRRAGEPLSMGIAPTQATAPDSPTDVLRTLSRLDLTEHPGNCVLDLELPLGGGLEAGDLTALMRAHARLGGATLQLNCVSPEELREAQAHPEAHRNLVVRICGLSAYFVTLDRAVQDEIIARHAMAG